MYGCIDKVPTIIHLYKISFELLNILTLNPITSSFTQSEDNFASIFVYYLICNSTKKVSLNSLRENLLWWQKAFGMKLWSVH